MPIYQYDPLRTDGSGIANLILRRGDSAAQQAERSGAIQAQGAENIGSAIGNAGRGIGSYILDAPRRQLEGLQVQSATQAMQDDQLFRHALSLSQNGDLTQAVAFLKSQGGAGITALQKLTAMARQQKDLHDDAAGEIGYITLKGGGTLDAFGRALREKVRSGEMANEEASGFLTTASQDATKIPTLARELMARSGKFRPLLDKIDFAKPGEVGIDPLTRQSIPGVGAPEKKPDYTINGQRFSGATGEPIGDAVPPQHPPQPKSLQSKSVMVNGKPVEAVFDPATGTLSVNGEDVTAKATPIPPASVQVNNAPGTADARRNNAEQIVAGNMPPSMLSKRSSDYNATLAEANKISIDRTGKPINLAQLENQYQAAKTFVRNMNSSQMIRYRSLSESVVNTIDEVQGLADALKQSSVQKWNAVKRSTIQQVYGNTPESELAAKYVGAVNTLKEEFANLANGGYAPTDAAWQLANEQINKDFGFKDLRASLTEVQRLINFRTQAFGDQKPYVPGGAPGEGPNVKDPLNLFGGRK